MYVCTYIHMTALKRPHVGKSPSLLTVDVNDFDFGVGVRDGRLASRTWDGKRCSSPQTSVGDDGAEDPGEVVLPL